MPGHERLRRCMIEQRSKVFLGGPPLVKMATGEESTDEELGGAVDARPGLGPGRLPGRRRGRRHPPGPPDRRAASTGASRGPGRPSPADDPVHDPDELLGIASADPKMPFDPREVLARVVDGSRFDEFKPLYGTSLVTGWASIHGYPIGVLANHRGVLFSEEAHKATQFIQLANQIDVPLLFLQNTTGYMVGKEYEQGGIIKHGAMMINAVSNSSVPHLTVNIGASYGAGNYGMCGRAYDPRFLFAWPNARSAVMGPGPAGRRAVDRGRASRPPPRASPSTRRPTRPMRAPGRGPDRVGVAPPPPVVPALRRRHHRPPRHPHGARRSACRSSTTSRPPAPAATACSGCERPMTPPRHAAAARRPATGHPPPGGQPRGDRPPHHADRPRHGHRHRGRPLRRRRRQPPRRRGRPRRPPARDARRPTPTSAHDLLLDAARAHAAPTPSTPGYGFLSESGRVRPGRDTVPA